MRSALLKGMLVLALCSAAASMPTRALASEWPLIPGDFWEVTGIHLKDGDGLIVGNAIYRFQAG